MENDINNDLNPDQNPYSDSKVKNSVDKFRKICYCHILIKFIIAIKILINLLNYDWYREAKRTLEEYYFPDPNEKTNKDILPILYGSVFLTGRAVVPLAIIIIIGRIIYNLKYLKFIDANNYVVWINNLLFYAIYSMITPLICCMITNKENYFYKVFIDIQGIFSFVICLPFLIILLIFLFHCFCNIAGSTREVGRGYRGNTEIIYYEYVDTEGIGWGGSCTGKICKWTYTLLIMLGFVVFVLMIVGFNDILMKILLIFEGCLNIYSYITIRKVREIVRFNHEMNMQREGLN